ncbi:hypothetical protein RIF25_12985 [Thermosynechococcaceae cyanobacterium BACA0444]|uniref:Uncharacterized protein n=1 Tax=Pseudocalidococcus azoricus BACA0444 TaxID=2918990 RepID=A0AAE4JY21_9CYAN|nr:hypothetical protein [Pseudocalidococcus azoricus]MDS3861718.1 hypothetical protein [Pseudocalidococcus azoricus BACA0444]
MKLFIYLAILALMYLPGAHLAHAREDFLPMTQGGYASPRSKATLFPNYYLFVNIGTQEVTELLIEFPLGLQVIRGIDVISNDQVIDDVSYTIYSDRITIRFNQPISQKDLKIVLMGTKYSNHLSPIKLLYLSANIKNTPNPVSIGTILIKAN